MRAVDVMLKGKKCGKITGKLKVSQAVDTKL